MSLAQDREKLSFSIAQLMPNIIQGVHIGFLTKTSLTHTQFLVLVAIHSHDRSPMRSLSTNLQVSMPTMTGIIERLVLAGFARRVTHPEDRRQVLVELTAKGKNIITEFQKAASVRWQTVLGTLNQKEIDVFDEIVMKLRENVRQANS